MASLNTNAAAMTALQTLSATNKNLAVVQNRISTGLRVSEAADNAAYWSIATTMRSDNKALSTVQDALGLGAGKLDVAYTGMHSAIEVVDEIKAKLVAARGVSQDDRTKIQAEITELQQQLISIGLSATFSGTNFLATDEIGAEEIVSSFNRDNDGNVSVGTIRFDVSSSRLFDFATDGAIETDVSAASGLLSEALTYIDDDGSAVALEVSVLTLDVEDATSGADIDLLISGVDRVLAQMTTAASDLGAAKKRVDMQQDFVSKLQDAIDRGVGQLVDADMNKESAQLQALQVQQQLGIQALSIANANTQNILALFRG